MIGGDGINDESNKTAPAPTRNTDLTKYILLRDLLRCGQLVRGLVRAPMEEASTSTRSSSSCDLRSPLRMRSSPLITPYRRGGSSPRVRTQFMKNYE